VHWRKAKAISTARDQHVDRHDRGDVLTGLQVRVSTDRVINSRQVKPWVRRPYISNIRQAVLDFRSLA
jgi:hypothetical protein